MRHATKRVFLCALAALTLTIIPGCFSPEDVEAKRDDITAYRDKVKEQALQLEQLRASAQGMGDEVRAEQIDAELAIARTVIDGADAAIAKLDETVSEFRAPTDPANQLVNGLLPFLPEPIRLPLAWGATIAVVALRSKRFRDAAVSIAESFEKLKAKAPEVDAAIRANVQLLDQYQTDAAKKIVDSVQPEKAKIVTVAAP